MFWNKSPLFFQIGYAVLLLWNNLKNQQYQTPFSRSSSSLGKTKPYLSIYYNESCNYYRRNHKFCSDLSLKKVVPVLFLQQEFFKQKWFHGGFLFFASKKLFTVIRFFCVGITPYTITMAGYRMQLHELNQKVSFIYKSWCISARCDGKVKRTQRERS